MRAVNMTFMDGETSYFLGASKAGSILDKMTVARESGRKLAAGDDSVSQEDVLSLLQTDVSEIAQTLAFEIRLAQNLPKEIITQIATSTDPEVSNPFVEASPALTEELMLELIDQISLSAQSAVAKRADITDAVATAIAETGNEKAALNVLRNDKADISEAAIDAISQHFPDSEKISHNLARTRKAQTVAKPAQQDQKVLPFNVLISRSRAFMRNGMLTASYIEKGLKAKSIAEVEAALCVLANQDRKFVRTALLKSHETRLDLERLCNLLPGTLTSNADLIHIAVAKGAGASAN